MLPERREKIDRVAFVPAGDNPDAHVVLWKSKRTEPRKEKTMQTVSKAADAATELRALVEKDLDRVPLDARGNRRTPQMALADVLKTSEGKELHHVIRDEGVAGSNAVAKAFPR